MHHHQDVQFASGSPENVHKSLGEIMRGHMFYFICGSEDCVNNEKKKKSTTDPAKCFCLTVGLSPSEHVSPPFPAILVLLRCLPEQNNPSSHCIFERENAT